MLRRLLLTTFVVGVTSALAVALLWRVTGDPASAQVERENCPAGFHWERMSGQCCVQDRETLPENGKIGYVGDSLCLESSGLIGVYERRPTTDGKGPPGCPGYTSFPFLKACVTPEEYQRLQQETGAAATGGENETGGGGEPSGGGDLTTGGTQGNRVEEAIRDASEALYDNGNGPSAGELAATGGGLAGLLVTAVVGSAFLGSPPVSGSPGVGTSPPEESLPPPPSPDQMVDNYERALAELRHQREEAWANWSTWADLLSFYRWHYWTAQPLRWMAVGGIGVAGGLSLGLTAEVTGPILAPAVKYLAAGVGTVFTERNSSWPPSQDEAAALIEKFKPRVDEAAERWYELNSQCTNMEEELAKLRQAAEWQRTAPGTANKAAGS